MALSPELQRQVDRLGADHALEIAQRASPTHISAGVEKAGIQVGEDVKLAELAKNINKGPSRSVPSARFKTGSHTDLQTGTATTAGELVSTTIRGINAEGSAHELLRKIGESSGSFLGDPLAPLSKEDRVVAADRWTSIYERCHVRPEDIQRHRELIINAPDNGITTRPVYHGSMELREPELETGVVGSLTKDIATRILSFFRKQPRKTPQWQGSNASGK